MNITLQVPPASGENTVTHSPGTDAASNAHVAARLADGTLVINGAGMVTYNPLLNYRPTSVGGALRSLSTSVSTGLSTSTSGLQSLSTSTSTGLSTVTSGVLSLSTSTSTGLSTVTSSFSSLSTSTSSGLSTATSGLTSLSASTSTGLSTVVSNLGSLSTALSTAGPTTGLDRVGFLQVGAGAVARRGQSKAQDIVSVLDFGGTWDGVADVSAVAQAALNSGVKVIDFINLPGLILTSLTIPSGIKVVNANLLSGTAGMKAVLVSTGSSFQGSIVGTGFAGAANEWGIYPAGDGITDVTLDATISNVSVAVQVFTAGATPPARWKGTVRTFGLVGGGSQSNGYALALFKANDCNFVLHANGTPRHDVYISAGASRNNVTVFSTACGGAPVQLAAFVGQPYCDSNRVVAFIDQAAPIVGNTADPYGCNMVGFCRNNNVEIHVTNSPLMNGGLLFRANAADNYPYRNYAKVFHTGGYAGAAGCIRSDSGVDNTVELYGHGQASAGVGTALISGAVYSGFIPTGPSSCTLRIVGLSWDAEGTNIRGIAALASYAPLDIGVGVSRGFKNSLGATVFLSGGGTVVNYFEPKPITYHGNVAFTVDSTQYVSTDIWNVALTADRAVTLSTAGAVLGDTRRILRMSTSTGAFSLNVGTGPLKSLAPGQWCDVGFDGTNWVVTASGNVATPGVQTITTTTTLAATSPATQLADATSGAITVTLPTAASASGLIFNIKKIDASANAVTIDGSGSETIDGATTLVLNAQWQSAQIQSNGTSWFIL